MLRTLPSHASVRTLLELIASRRPAGKLKEGVGLHWGKVPGFIKRQLIRALTLSSRLMRSCKPYVLLPAIMLTTSQTESRTRSQLGPRCT